MRLREALALGALHGPAELLPISSSGHTELVPWLAGWEYPSLDPELRKAFEVALHAGTAAALLIALRDEVGEAAGGPGHTPPRPRWRTSAAPLAVGRRRRIELIAGSFAVPAVVGLALERQIEERLGGPRSIALGLLAGSVAMLAVDRMPELRHRDDATLTDALALGVAQACALIPGVSRNGATLVAARARGFARRDASVLSRHTALPVIAGATLLKGVRLARRGLPREARVAFAGGTAASFASTLACARLVRDDRPLWPFAVYRTAIAATALGVARLWKHGER